MSCWLLYHLLMLKMRVILQHLFQIQKLSLLLLLYYRGLSMNALFFLMQTLCILLPCKHLAYVFPLTHRFPLKSAIKCWSSWQPFWNIIISNSIHRYLHCRDAKEKGFPVIFHSGIVLSTWHGLGSLAGAILYLLFSDQPSSAAAIYNMLRKLDSGLRQSPSC